MLLAASSFMSVIFSSCDISAFKATFYSMQLEYNQKLLKKNQKIIHKRSPVLLNMIYLTVLQLLSPQVILSLFLHVPLTLFLLEEVVHIFLNEVWHYWFVFYVLLC